MFLSQHRFFIRGTGDLLKHFEIQMDPIFFDSHSCSINNKPTFLKSLSRFSFRFIAGFVCWFVFCEANIIEFLAARYPTVSCNT